MDNILAFIDEFGDSCMETSKKNISTLFIIVAIIIKQSQRDQLETALQTIRDKYFQGSEIKSSNIKGNDKRRKIVLEQLTLQNFKFYAYVIDKTKLNGRGFSYRKSFYKFAHGILDRELFTTIPSIKLYADEIGSGDFMRSFVEYIRRTKMPNLFDNEYLFIDSKSSNINQLADLIAGTLGRCYDKKFLSSNRRDFMDLLKDKVLGINSWPIDYNLHIYRDNDSGIDNKIRDASIQKAKGFLFEYKQNKGDYYEEQRIVVDYLLFYLTNIDSKKFISSRTLLSILKYDRESRINSQRNLMQHVIGPLRDHKVLIASSRNGKNGTGYKLPANLKDIDDFIDTFNSQITPMLNRLKKCQEVIQLATIGELDILKQEKYETMSRIMKVI